MYIIIFSVAGIFSPRENGGLAGVKVGLKKR